MKATTICTILLATGTALAVPTKRAEKAVTISGLYASQTDKSGFVSFILDDPNYDEETGANVSWDRPGNPLTDSRTSDGAYFIHFPGGVNDISVFTMQLERVKGPESFSVSINDNGNGSAPGTKWKCVTAVGSVVSKKCHYDGNVTVVPSA
ncbi:hypothetical protein ETB97_004839 [Aspergillus alliaceus]|uniref:Uncharacterized protein n=1 Tax=Petromyces alliaceus TaxID=209559 RepID=A0A8H6AB34_PETAA|nr:hypothetical protein ETB97_004839 [Aspergillus burnettii]